MKKVWYIAGAVGLLAVLGYFNKETIMDTWDKYTNFRVEKLHPIIKDKVKLVINRLADKQGIYLRITSDGHLRTFDDQDALYAIGRTIELDRSPVTNAQAGQSWHNYGLAVDVVQIKDGNPLWTNPNWSIIANEFKKEGFEWGGDFKSIKDKPHFQYRPNNITLVQAKSLYDSKQFSIGEYIKLTA